MSALEEIAIVGVVAAVVVGGVIAYTELNNTPANQAKQQQQNLSNAYTLSTLPIVQAGATDTIISGVQSVAQSSGYGTTYNNPAIIYTNQPANFAAMIQQSTANNNSAVINVTPTGISTYGGNIDSTVMQNNTIGTSTGVWAAGTIGNPFNAASGWQGVGYYKGLASEAALTQYVTDSNTFAQLNI